MTKDEVVKVTDIMTFFLTFEEAAKEEVEKRLLAVRDEIIMQLIEVEGFDAAGAKLAAIPAVVYVQIFDKTHDYKIAREMMNRAFENLMNAFPFAQEVYGEEIDKWLWNFVLMHNIFWEEDDDW